MTRPAHDYGVDDALAAKGFEQAKAAVLIDRWAPLLKFWIPGEPQAQPRAKAARVGGFVRVYTPATADNWKRNIEIYSKPFQPDSPYDCPLRVDVIYFFSRPEYLLRPDSPRDPIPHPQKPDRDNCDKALLDTLTGLKFWKDDKQVFDGRIRKYYVPLFGQPGALVTISRVPE